MLMKALREERPDHVVVVFDARGGSESRRALFAEYKATRDAQPEDLSRQLPLVRELVEAYRIPVLEVPGCEADDVIATLVARAPADAHDHDPLDRQGPDAARVASASQLLDTMKGSALRAGSRSRSASACRPNACSTCARSSATRPTTSRA